MLMRTLGILFSAVVFLALCIAIVLRVLLPAATEPRVTAFATTGPVAFRPSVELTTRTESAVAAVQAPTVAITTEAAPTAAATATPMTTPSGAMPGLPLRAAFYYPWFPQAWNQNHINPYTHYNPLLGLYSSTDAAVIRRHIAEMEYGNIQAGISSWWGQGTPTDQAFAQILNVTAGTNFHWAIYYELQGQSDVSADQINRDLVYIRDHYANDPGYLKFGGRFVVFAYGKSSDGCATTDRWKQANNVGAYIVLKVFTGFRSCPSQPDGWHQYAPANSDSDQKGYGYTISPGFWKAGEAVRLPRDLNRWNDSIRKMIASNEPFQLITSFNEWGEGTAVEPAQEWATSSSFGAYLDALHDNGQGTAPVITAQAQTATPVASTPQAVAPRAQTRTSATAQAPAPQVQVPPLPPVNGDPIMVAVGDIACDPTSPLFTAGKQADCREKATSDLAMGLFETGRLAVVAPLGDNTYENGALDKYDSSYDPTWGRLKDITRPAVGNHEYLTPGAQGYFGYFGMLAGSPRQGYYSYDVGAWHVVVINSNCSEVGGCAAGSPQETWLRQDLATNAANKCTLAYWHHPLYSSGEHGDDAAVRTLWQDLYDYGTAVVLSGHSHDYERFAPQDANGNADPKGIREFVVGTGGKNHTGLVSLQPNSQVFNDNTFGILELTLHASGYDWRFVPEPGKTFTDSGSAGCQPRKP